LYLRISHLQVFAWVVAILRRKVIVGGIAVR
jgi:hypothetical protein